MYTTLTGMCSQSWTTATSRFPQDPPHSAQSPSQVEFLTPEELPGHKQSLPLLESLPAGLLDTLSLDTLS